MKKLLCIILITVLLLLSAFAYAEDWICPSCSSTATGNFCNNCGAAKPSEEWICPSCSNTETGKFCSNCGNARPTEESAVTTDSLLVKDDPDEIKRVINYSLNPITTATVSNYIDMGGDTFSVMMTNGDSYIGLISDSDGAYAIEIMNYSSSDYSSVESPYDYTSDEFKDVLNYLLRKKGCTVTAIIPMFGDICSVQDSKGGSYMLSIMCSPSMVMIGLLGD